MKGTRIRSNWIVYCYLALLLIFRNIRWLGLIFFNRNKRIWNVLKFRMYLNSRGVGIDLKENSVHKQLILDEVREKEATKIMESFIEPNDIILELGANIGYYVLIEASKLFDSGHIYAVEPGPENIKLLRKNVQLNHVKNIEIVHMAMGNRLGMSKLYLSKTANFHSLINIPGAHNAKRYLNIKTDTVDNFLKNRKAITFLRMDIEGYEVEVIKGMKKTLQNPNLKKMFVELHPRNVPLFKIVNFLETLYSSGFEIECAISRDNYLRSAIRQTKIERISIKKLIVKLQRSNEKTALEVFFRRKK